ncbi:MATE family efflux transporter [Stakelama tenebrarum]|uniref:MATE family efflux transporter n=1 Tax=Stakelama tenebrarum TaxID=2711215 RepID=A0A6G6Y9T4_9SPHN|nr:MATE family efflux transporter [Sphingosinithalassobacter tenebrarum]QIG81702.1 MATE family efflux transporter [Sphingosinithalassobacter tenebrarum]
MPHATPILAETRRILALAWPVMITSLNWNIMQITDVALLGLIGPGEVAALGASRALTLVLVVLAIGAMSGVLVYASRADGAGDTAGTGRVYHQALALGLALGLAFGALLWLFAHPLLLLIGVAPETAPRGAAVVRAIAIAFPFQLPLIAISFFLEGLSHPRRVMAINMAMLPLNGLLTWALSGGHLGLPMLGAVGAALGTALSAIAGVAGLLVAAWYLPDAHERGIRAWRRIATGETLRGAVALFRFGIAPAIASGLEILGFAILIALSTQLGTATAHAFQIVFSVHNLTFALALGFGSAAGVRVGNAIGEGRRETVTVRTGIAAGLTVLVTGGFALFLVLFGGTVVSLFPAIDPVHRIAATILALWAPFILFDGVQLVFVYALRSLGDQVIAGINSTIAFFGITGLLGLTLVHAGWGPPALAQASGAGMVASALLNSGRFAWISWRARPRS